LTKSPQVAARVRSSLHLASASSAVGALITVTPQEQSNILTITGMGESPDEAARIANAFAQALLAERTERLQRQLHRVVASLTSRLRAIGNRPGNSEAAALSSRIADYRALYGETDPTLELVSAAVPPSAPTSPRPLLSVVVAGVVGLLLGIGIAVGLEIANPVVMRAESIAEQDGPPILARVPRPTDDDVRAALLDPDELPPEIRASIRTLWANLSSLPNQSPGTTLLITSAAEGEGSPAVATVLAALLARGGTSVVLIDADLERGPLASMVDGKVRLVASLGQLLASEDALPIPSAVEPLASSQRLQVLLAYPEDRHLTEWLPPERLSALVAQLKRNADAIVVSAPPLPAAETTVLTDLADAVIVTVAVGRTRRDRLTRLREGLAERGVVPAGFVVLERPSLLTRIAQVPPKPSAQRRWA
jgi:receptor protein-tyrosine kinase